MGIIGLKLPKLGFCAQSLGYVQQGDKGRIELFGWQRKGDRENHVTGLPVQGQDLGLLGVVSSALKVRDDNSSSHLRCGSEEIPHRLDEVRRALTTKERNCCAVDLCHAHDFLDELDQLRMRIKKICYVGDPIRSETVENPACGACIDLPQGGRHVANEVSIAVFACSQHPRCAVIACGTVDADARRREVGQFNPASYHRWSPRSSYPQQAR